MSTEFKAAERTWFAIAPDGTEHDVVLGVGAPFLDPQGNWTAPVSFGILERRIHNIVGVDGWQAVGLAMRFAATMLQDYEEKGWRFYWERGGPAASSSDLAEPFPDTGRKWVLAGGACGKATAWVLGSRA